MKVIAAVFSSLIFGNVLFAQSDVNFDFGARAGVPITKPLSENDTGFLNGVPCCFSSTDSIARTFIVGPAVAVRFFDRIRVEFDALYRPLREVTEFSTFSAPITPITTTRIHGTLWDFPAMANYRFLSGAVRPYAGVGLVLLRSVSATQQVTDIRRPGTLVSRFSGDHGFPAYTAQAGLEWKYAHLVIRPEARYSYWRPITSAFSPIIMQKNQVEFLVGFAFEPSKNK
jgi:hypothetical protein